MVTEAQLERSKRKFEAADAAVEAAQAEYKTAKLCYEILLNEYHKDKIKNTLQPDGTATIATLGAILETEGKSLSEIEDECLPYY